jgi:hypothetical protein
MYAGRYVKYIYFSIAVAQGHSKKIDLDIVRAENCYGFCRCMTSWDLETQRVLFLNLERSYLQEKEKLGGLAQTACESINFPWRYRGRHGGSTPVIVVASSAPRRAAAGHPQRNA